jgi:hypothetical protein
MKQGRAGEIRRRNFPGRMTLDLGHRRTVLVSAKSMSAAGRVELLQLLPHEAGERLHARSASAAGSLDRAVVRHCKHGYVWRLRLTVLNGIRVARAQLITMFATTCGACLVQGAVSPT